MLLQKKPKKPTWLTAQMALHVFFTAQHAVLNLTSDLPEGEKL